MLINLTANSGNTINVGLIPQSERYPGEGSVNPVQYSCLENSIDRQVTAHGVTESDMTECACMHMYIYAYMWGLLFIM